MQSLILRTTARYLMPLLLMFSAFAFLRGHNEPGGGFASGLVAAAAFALYSFAFGPAAARRALRIEPRLLIGLGLLVALGSGLGALPAGLPFLTGVWGFLHLPEGLDRNFGTPLIFDFGVYLAVLGVTLTIIFALEETE